MIFFGVCSILLVFKKHCLLFSSDKFAADCPIGSLVVYGSHWSSNISVYPTPFWIVDSAPWIPDPILCQWNLDSGLQSLVVFRIRRAVFLIPKPGIPDTRNKIFQYSGYGFLKQKFPGFRISLHGTILDNFPFKFLQHSVNMDLVQLVKSRVRKRR